MWYSFFVKLFIVSITYKINRILGKFFKINIRKKNNSFEDAQQHLIKIAKIDLLIDGGANLGQYAKIVRQFYKDNLLSIEPIPSNYNRILARFIGDKKFFAENVAIGDANGKKELYLSNFDGVSSSIYKPRKHLNYYLNIKFESKLKVKVIRLDTINLAKQAKSIYLKLDLQGYELVALRGASKLFHKINVIEIEVSFVEEMYTNNVTLKLLLSYLEKKGFFIYSVSDFQRTKDGRTIYADFIFAKESLIKDTVPY